MIDLRSDTVTKPTAAMRRAMAEAEVGDDVYGEDPTVRKLEERVAEILGKPASLFLPSGTMGNTIGIKLHTRHGEEVVCDHRAHILDWEMSMMAWFSGCLARPVPTEDGVLRWSDIEPVVRPRTGFPAPTAMVNIEHPHNMGGGTLFSTDNIDTICDRAHERGLKVHMDGARLFNAVAASGETAARIVAKDRHCDVLPVEGSGSAGRLDARGRRRDDGRGASLSQAPGRRDAAGRHPRGRGAGGPGRVLP